MRFIRRPIEKWHSKSEITPYDLEKEIKEIVEIKEKISCMKDEINNIMQNIIYRQEDKKIRNRLSEVRTKVYKNNKPYPQKYNDIVDYISFLSNEAELINKDIILRGRLEIKEKDFEEHFNINTEETKKVIENMVVNDQFFLERVAVANRNIFDNIKKNSIDRYQYMTLLKYIYKQETCCTPSSFWSGISTQFFQNQSDNIKSLYWKEENRYVSKKYFLEEIKNSIINDKLEDIETLKFRVNETMLSVDNKLLFMQFWGKEAKLIKIVENELLRELIEIKEFDILKLYEILQTNGLNKKHISEAIIQCIDNQIILPTYRLEYGNYNLKTYKVNDYIDDIKNSKASDEFYGMYVGSTKCKSENEVDKYLYEAFSIYYSLQLAFYEKVKEKDNITQIKDFVLKKGGKISIKEILYSDIEFSYIKNIHTTNYKCWVQPKDENKIEVFLRFIELIKVKIDGQPGDRIINLKWKEIREELKIDHYQVPNAEVIYCECDNAIIFEMISSQIGRLILRYLKYCPDSIKQIAEEHFEGIYSNDNNIQVNLELKNNKDNIGFNIPGVKKFMYLYDYNVTDKMGEDFSMDDVYIAVENNNLKIVDANGKELNVLFSSSIMPSGHKAYKVLNLIKNQNNGHILNGMGFSRIELDKDYQPRIQIENLLISRERFRIDCSELKKSLDIKDFHKKLFEVLAENKVPFEYYYYSDSKFKPKYGRMANKYDVLFIVNEIRNCFKYVYFEEVFPCPNKGEFAVEYWEDIWRKE